MNRLALLSLPLLFLTTPASSADLGPYYSERERIIERPPPPRVVERERIIERPPPPRVVERERIIERHYYEPAPVYRERRVYVEPREYVYAPRVYDGGVYYDRPYRYAYAHSRPHYFFPRRPFWHRHHRWW